MGSVLAQKMKIPYSPTPPLPVEGRSNLCGLCSSCRTRAIQEPSHAGVALGHYHCELQSNFASFCPSKYGKVDSPKYTSIPKYTCSEGSVWAKDAHGEQLKLELE